MRRFLPLLLILSACYSAEDLNLVEDAVVPGEYIVGMADHATEDEVLIVDLGTYRGKTYAGGNEQETKMDWLNVVLKSIERRVTEELGVLLDDLKTRFTAGHKIVAYTRKHTFGSRIPFRILNHKRPAVGKNQTCHIHQNQQSRDNSSFTHNIAP